MKQEEIIEGNKLIAEFMGAIIDNKTKDSDDPIFEFPVSPSKFNFPYKRYHLSWFGGFREFANNEERYNNSWNWLMPVVKKISDFSDIDKHKESTGWYAHYGIESFLFEVNIEKTWELCIEFIKWYNNQIKN